MLKHSEIIAHWLSQIPPQSIPKLFGSGAQKLITAAQEYDLELTKYNALVEIPLSGAPGADISFCFWKKLLEKTSFTTPQLQKLSPLMRHLLQFLQDEEMVFLELDTASLEGKNKLPSIFWDCATGQDKIWDGLWAPGGAPRQWEQAKDLCKSIPKEWQLYHLGFMPGRSNAPLRLIFTLREDDSCSFNNAKELLNSLDYKDIPLDMKNKLQTAAELGYLNWGIDLDLEPDGTLGNTLGAEIIGLTSEIPPAHSLTHPNAVKMFRRLQDWGLANELWQELQNCAGEFVIAPAWTSSKGMLWVFLNHFKLRWIKGEPQVAKAYLGLLSENE